MLLTSDQNISERKLPVTENSLLKLTFSQTKAIIYFCVSCTLIEDSSAACTILEHDQCGSDGLWKHIATGDLHILARYVHTVGPPNPGQYPPLWGWSVSTAPG